MSHWPPKKQHRPAHAHTFGGGQSAGPSVPPEHPPPEPPENPPPANPRPVNPRPVGSRPPLPLPPGADIEVPHTTKGPRTHEQKMQAMTIRHRANMEVLAKRYGGKENILRKLRENAQKELDSRHPLTREHHERMLRSWAVVLCEIAPEVDPNDQWLDTVVQKYAEQFLDFKTQVTPGRDGLCHAGTVGGWVSTLVYCISKYTYNSGRIVVGPKLLREGLWQRLDDVYRHLIKEHQLERHNYSKLVSYGKEEFQLIAEEALQNERGRIVKLQTMAGLLFAFGCGVRPSGLAAPHDEFIKLGRYMRLGDVRPIRTGKFSFDLHVSFKNHKGWNNTTHGLLSVYVFKALNNVENLLVDPIWMLAYMTARGAFIHKTTQAVIDSNDSELKVVIPDEPLQGGSDLVYPIEPAQANNVSDSASHLIKSTGLNGSSYAFRRGVANDADIALGAHKASIILGHADAQSTLSSHYSMSTANFDLLGIRTGEATEQYQPGVKETLELHCRTRAAVVLLASRSAAKRIKEQEGESGTSEKGKNKASEEDELSELAKAAKKEVIENSDEVAAVDENIKATWKELLGIIEPNDADYPKAAKMSVLQQNVKHLVGRKSFKAAVKASPAKAAKAIELETRVRKLFNQLTKTKIALARVSKREVTREFENRPKASDTVAERDEAIAHFAKPSKILEIPAEPSSSKTSSKAAPVQLVPIQPAPTRSAESTLAESTPAESTPAQSTPAWSAPVYKPAHELSKDERRRELEQLNATDDAVPADEAAKAALNLMNLPHKSLAGITPANSETLTRVLVSASGEAPNASQIDAMDSEVFIDEPLEPYDDKDEEPQIKDLPMSDAREAFFRFLLAPIEREREAARQKAADGGLLLCQLCKRDPDNELRPWDTLGHLERHMIKHTEWNDLKLRIKVVGGKFLCPASNCQKPLGSVKIVRRHCTRACPEKEGFRLMKKLHNRTYREYRIKYGGSSKEDENDEGEDEDQDDQNDEDGEDGEDGEDSEDEDEEEDGNKGKDDCEPTATQLKWAKHLAGLDEETLMALGTKYELLSEEFEAYGPSMVEAANKAGNILLNYDA